jgi:hypothetical protein
MIASIVGKNPTNENSFCSKKPREALNVTTDTEA